MAVTRSFADATALQMCAVYWDRHFNGRIEEAWPEGEYVELGDRFLMHFLPRPLEGLEKQIDDAMYEGLVAEWQKAHPKRWWQRGRHPR